MAKGIYSETDIRAAMERACHVGRSAFGKGKRADYIPPLREVPPRQFGIAVNTIYGDEYTMGSAQVPFSIQSIVKVFVLIKALSFDRERFWSFVDREPSSSGFHSASELEEYNGIPRNPLINAGAMVTLDRLCQHTNETPNGIIEFARYFAACEHIVFDPDVADAEAKSGNINWALAYLLRDHERITLPPEDLLLKYFKLCSLSMSCQQLARLGVALANNGRSPWVENRMASPDIIRRVNAVMFTCGMYGAVGDFAYRVGTPAKSGVGGGVLVSVPGVMSVAVWAPELDSTGSSLPGIVALECFSEELGLSLFNGR